MTFVLMCLTILLITVWFVLDELPMDDDLMAGWYEEWSKDEEDSV